MKDSIVFMILTICFYKLPYLYKRKIHLYKLTRKPFALRQFAIMPVLNYRLKNAQLVALYPGGQKKLYEGHYITNEKELEAVRRKLTLCLCDKYIQSHDPKLKLKS